MHLDIYFRNNLYMSEKCCTFAGQICEIIKKYNKMKRCKSLFLCIALLISSVVYAQQEWKEEMFEIGVQTGIGFGWSNTAPMSGINRQFHNGWISQLEIPAMETFGGMLRCNIDERWTVQVQAMAQRVMFSEDVPSHTTQRFTYYNTMCNLDATAEFNLIKYGFFNDRRGKVYTMVPYIAVGVGCAMYNKDATFRFSDRADGHAKYNTSYPTISSDGMATAMYIPFGLGAKFRLTGNWQIRLACQYDLYVLGTDKMVDIYGATFADGAELKKWDKEDYSKTPTPPNFNGRPTYEDLKSAYAGKNVIGNSHNVMLTFGVIFNFTEQYKGMVVEY